MHLQRWYAFGILANIIPAIRAASFSEAQAALDKLRIPNSDDVRGYLTLPSAIEDSPACHIEWKSSDPEIISDAPKGKIGAGVVNRPPPGSEPAKVILTACVNSGHDKACREFNVTVRPAVKLAERSRYGMSNFARSNSQAGQQIYMAYSVGNDATNWVAINNGKAVLKSVHGMHGVRDPSITRSPEGDMFYLIATDLNVDGVDYGWLDWDWAQSNASRYIEVWESRDLRTWSEQRHVLVSPSTVGMTYAPESIWDPEIGAYVVYWTSSLYPEGTYYTTNETDPNRRYPLTRNQAMYTTTRDFQTFTPAKVMTDRPDHGTLDSVIIKDEENGYYHRLVCDRISTGNATQYVPCGGEDIYQERAKSILAEEDEWELVKGCITHDLMNTTYAEGALIVKANPGDPRGDGWYMYADQKWEGSPAGGPLEEQYHPYWTDDLESGHWKPIDWVQKPDYDLAEGVIRHGNIISLTTAEHAAWRGADLTSIRIKSEPIKTKYSIGESLDVTGLSLEATYTDGIVDELFEGYGGYSISCFDSETPGEKTIEISYTVVNLTKTATFSVFVQN
ncbi:hypothetical protein FQN54_000066 [Arachnomyces sp. PD_36]|nr:hypothetical protein FQN54_000066 [Arachnomyces sp. PD_36]